MLTVMHHVVLYWDGRMGQKPAPLLGPFFNISYLSSNCLVSQKATSGRVTEIICHLGKLGEVIMSERGGCERKSPTSSRLFYRELHIVGKGIFKGEVILCASKPLRALPR